MSTKAPVKTTFLILTLLLTLHQGKCQFWGLSVNPDLDSKVQIPIVSYPYRTGFSHSLKTSFNLHFLYVFRVGAGIGINHASNPLYLPLSYPNNLKKLRFNRTSLAVPLHVIGCIPVRGLAMPFVQYQSNLLFPLRLESVARYSDHKERIRYANNDFAIENNIRMGVLVRNDDRTGELACSLQLSFTSTRNQDLRFIGIGLNVQYFFIVTHKGLND